MILPSNDGDTRPLGARRMRLMLIAQEELVRALAIIQSERGLTDAEVAWLLMHVAELLARRLVEDAWVQDTIPTSPAAVLELAARTISELHNQGL